MLLNDYLNKLKTTNLKELNKPWLNSELLNNDFLDNIYPDSKAEEWKNFNVKAFIDKKWKLLESKNSPSFKKENISFKNLIVFNNGVLEKNLTEINKEDKIKIFSLNEYYNKDNTIVDRIYSNSKKYSEDRISGIIDNKTTSLLSLNALLNHGVVIEVSSNAKVDNEICLYNQISANDTIINPYVLLVANKNSEVRFLDLTSYIEENSWTNVFYEFYLEKNSKVRMSNFSLNQSMNLNTSSYNFHLEKEALLEFASINKGNSKKDIRVFLNGENSKVDIKGMLLSRLIENSDIFCKVTHNAFSSDSKQDWRMISADTSKTSLNGKIKIMKGAKNSSGNFFSKALLLNDKAKAFSKPELEIFEDDVSCSHGSSFGELEKDKVFYLQSRGFSKKEAIEMLVSAFISELNFSDNNLSENLKSEVEKMFIGKDL
jgi:Fe-S cluster assembly protein SufD